MRTIEQRFFAKVIKTPKCWAWIGAKGSNGYGQMQMGPRKQQAHRIAYELFVGPIPEGLTIDHICRFKDCVNPSHLRTMTMLENVMDGCVNAKKDHCPQGHKYDEANTIHYRTFRYCRECKRAKDKAHHLKYRDRILARKREAWRKAAGRE